MVTYTFIGLDGSSWSFDFWAHGHTARRILTLAHSLSGCAKYIHINVRGYQSWEWRNNET